MGRRGRSRRNPVAIAAGVVVLGCVAVSVAGAPSGSPARTERAQVATEVAAAAPVAVVPSHRPAPAVPQPLRIKHETSRPTPRPTATADPIPVPKAPSAAPTSSPPYRPGHHLPTVAETAPDGTTWQVLAGWSDPASWQQRGTVISTTLHGAASGLSELAWVYLPAAYFQPGPRNLPITIVFSGYPGHPDNLITRQHYPQATLAGIAAGTIAPSVLVMLAPSVTYPWDTECSDIPDGPQAFTFYDRDVPDATAVQFHLQPDSYDAIGDSTGGYCAAKLQSFDPSRFTVAASLSGYYRPATDPTTHRVFADNALREHNDLGWRLQHLPVPAVSLLLATARDEAGPDGWTTNHAWLRLIQHPMTADGLILDHGGHNFASWDREIPYALSWISGHLPHAHTAPAPVPAGATVQPAGSPLDQPEAPSWSPRSRIASGEPPRSHVRSGRRSAT